MAKILLVCGEQTIALNGEVKGGELPAGADPLELSLVLVQGGNPSVVFKVKDEVKILILPLD